MGSIRGRLYYLQGTVKQVTKNNEGKNVIQFLVEKPFHSGASGVLSPYEAGKDYSFFLKVLPKIDILNKKVIIYGGQVTSNDQDNFEGAIVVYRELNHNFVDLNGKAAHLPPTDYPYSF